MKFGLVKDWREPDRAHAIQIRQDHQTRRWLAGDGLSPIPKLDPTRLNLAEARTPIYHAAKL